MLGAGSRARWPTGATGVTVLQRRPAGLGLPEVLADVADADAVRAAACGAGRRRPPRRQGQRDRPGGRVPAGQRARHPRGRRRLSGGRRATPGARLVALGRPLRQLAGRPRRRSGRSGAARGPYARSKAIAEQIALAADRGQLAVVAIRPHLVWGPGDTQLVARVVDRARRGRLPLIGSGAALIDTTYVDNAVDALLAALDHCVEARGQALVVTNGEPRPIAEMLAALCRAAGAPARLGTCRCDWHVRAGPGGVAVDVDQGLRPGRSGDDPPLTRFLVEQLSTAHWFDQRHARQVLQWQPRVSLDEGFAELQRWYLACRASRL